MPIVSKKRSSENRKHARGVPLLGWPPISMGVDQQDANAGKLKVAETTPGNARTRRTSSARN
jgi:hypothetical protein